MVPDNLRYGGGVASTVLHPAVAVIMIVAGLLILFLPQRKFIVPFLLVGILIPQDQVLVLGGLHFPVLRVLIIFGIVRMIMMKAQGKTLFSAGVNRIDILFIVLALATAVSGVLLFNNSQALIYQVGGLYSALGAYILLRCAIRDDEDAVQSIRTLAFIVVFLAAVMACEQLTKGWNPYFLLGGARGVWSMERDGAVRSMGSFAQALLAGTFGAVSVPLFAGLWMKENRYRITAVMGMIAGTMMAIASHSSTCLSALMGGVLALCLWQVRGMMRIIRWSIVIVLVTLHLVMKAPVWHLISRIDLSGGSTSWHRYFLIDTCIGHFWNWWLIGTRDNASWGWGMWDTANQFVANAYDAGILGVICLVAILVYGYKYVGWARQAITGKKEQLFLWALGASLFSYTMAFIGVSLWDQSILEWYMLLAIIGAVAVPLLQTAEIPAPTSAGSVIPAAPDFEPAYEGWSSRRLRDPKFKAEERLNPVYRKRSREFHNL